MATFDHAKWQSETTWPGETPSLAEVWAILQSGGLDPWFREQVWVRLRGSPFLKAAFAQSLTKPGFSTTEVQARFREKSGLNVKRATVEALLEVEAEPSARWNNRFANLVSGRFTELVFQAAYEPLLKVAGLVLTEETAERTFSDFRITAHDQGENFDLAINVKNAGVRFRGAQQYVGLDPEDTIPMATYKAFGAAKAHLPPLLYVFLVDWGLFERLRAAYWRNVLTASEKEVFRLMTSFKRVPRNLEDDFINATVMHRLDQLTELVGYKDLADLPFRTISAGRCHAIFYEQHERSPYVYIKRMETDPNVHISVKAETAHFGDVISKHLDTKAERSAFIKALGRTKPIAIPDPPV